MQQKTVVITGGNSGIGFQAARSLAARGAQVVLACRRLEAAEEARKQIIHYAPGALVELVHLDLADLQSVRRAAAEIRSRWPMIDVLVNNAGLANMRREESREGFELTLATNHLGHFLLTNLLLDQLKAAPSARIINVASEAHRMGRINWDDLNLEKRYWVMGAYSQSKLANILFSNALARRLEGTRVTSNALHPGAVSTNIWPEKNWLEKTVSKVIKAFTVSDEEGAKTTIWLASDPSLTQRSGEYFVNCKPRKPAVRADDLENQERLWERSAQMVGL